MPLGDARDLLQPEIAANCDGQLPGGPLAGIVQPASIARMPPFDLGDRFQQAPAAGVLRSMRVCLDEFTRRAPNIVSDRSGWTLRRQPKYLLQAFEHRR